jgi:hypothetical protein
MKRIAILSILLLATAGTAQAQNIGIGKYAGEWMATGIGSRALAMGGAYVAVANDVSGAYWNPASLMNTQYPELGLMHEQRFGGLLNFNYGGVAWPLSPRHTVALTVTRSGVDDIPDTRNALIDLNGNGQLDPGERLDYSKITSFSSADWAVYFSYATMFNPRMRAGVNLKLIQRSMGSNSAYGVGFDIGVLYDLTPQLRLGAAVQDVTTTLLAWDTGRNDLISPTLKIGGAYMWDILGGTVTPAMDFDIMFENRQYASTANLGPVSINPRLGIEYTYSKVVSVRAGMNDMKQLTFGAGFHLPKLYIDYAFGENPMAESLMKESSHRISLRLVLEEKRFARAESR